MGLNAPQHVGITRMANVTILLKVQFPDDDKIEDDLDIKIKLRHDIIHDIITSHGTLQSESYLELNNDN